MTTTPRTERKVVTVLFADLVGFTGRAEALDPEDVQAILSPYHARLRDELERFGGTVEKFIGDAVMAVFGAPVAHEDDPERAVRAALGIRDWAIAEGGVELRIAVNTGEALVSLDARPEAGEGMVAGDVVNTAARLQAAAQVNGVLVGEATFRATRDAVEYRDAAPVDAKGKAEPIPVWEAVEARSRVAVEVQQPRAPLVGRHREVDLLRDAFERVRSERSAQLVTLIAAPGIGKSRLVYELFQVVEADPELIWWRQGRSLPYGEGVSFWALGEMVKAQAGILDTDPPATAESKLRTTLETFEDGEWLETHLRPLVGLGGEPATGSDRRDEAFAAWRRFLEALAEERPLVLVFEDLHWADDGLLDFVDHLVDWASGVPILVVCSARPELLDRRPGWGGGKRNATAISLAPLSDEEVARLIAALLDRAVLPAETQALLLERAEGNPLYAEEFTRMLGDERGAAGVIPETLQGLIAARLDSLGPEDKALLQQASVVGKVFWLGALEAMTEQDRRQLEQRLHALERKEFVRRDRRSSVEGDSEYAFLHVLVRDVAYGQIPRAGRAGRHAAAAAWIQSLGRPDETAEMLAHHYLSALDYARAAGGDTSAFAASARVALREAGDRAMTLHAAETAARYYRAALALWPEDDAGWPDLVVRLGRTGGPDVSAEELGVMARACDALRDRGDVVSAAELEMDLAGVLWVQGTGDLVHEHAERAVQLIADAPTSVIKVHVLGQRARLHMLADESEEALDIATAALTMAEGLGARAIQAHLLNVIGTARANEGDGSGIQMLERSIDFGLELRSPSLIHRGYNNLAQTHWMWGALEQAAAALAESRRWGLEFGFDAGLLWVSAEDADLAYVRGDWDEAESRSDEFLARLEGTPGSHYQLTNVKRARALLALGRRGPAEALAESEASLEIARGSKDPQAELPALVCHAAVLLAADRRAEARAVAHELIDRRDAGGTWPSWYSIVEVAWVFVDVGLADEAAAIRDRGSEERLWARGASAIGRGELVEAAEIFAGAGARPYEAYARLRVAEALSAGGDRLEAEAQLQRALAFYQSVGASWYVRQAERLLAAAG